MGLDMVSHVPVDVFHRLLYNAKLYQVGKDAPNATFTFGEDDVIQMSVFDRYTYLTDRGMYDAGHYTYSVELPSEAVKELEGWLREYDDEQLELDIDTDNHLLSVTCRGETDTVEYVRWQKDTEGYETLTSEASMSSLNTPVALFGDRFRKLALVQPQDYPVDMRVVEHEKFGEMIAFKKGPSVVGAIAALNRETIIAGGLVAGRELW